MNRKGSLDIFVMIVMFLVAAVVLIAAYITISKINDTGIFQDDDTAQGIIDSGQNSLLYMDTMMLFVILGMSLFVVISSALVFNHPAYFFISGFLLFIAITIAGTLSNAFSVFTDNSSINPYALVYPKTIWVMNHLPTYLLLLGSVMAIAMFISWRQQ